MNQYFTRIFRKVSLTICSVSILWAATLRADVINPFAYTTIASTHVYTSEGTESQSAGAVDSNSAQTVSVAQTEPTSTASISGTANFGALQVSASATNTPYAPVDGGCDPGGPGFGDLCYPTSNAEISVGSYDTLTFSGLPAGTPVQFVVTETLDDGFTVNDDAEANALMAEDEYYGENDICPATVSFTGPAGNILDSPCLAAASKTVSNTIDWVTGGSGYSFSTALAASVSAYSAEDLGGTFYASANDQVAATAIGTIDGDIGIEILTPGVTVTAASGTDYLTTATPEPETILLAGIGVGGILLSRLITRLRASNVKRSEDKQ